MKVRKFPHHMEKISGLLRDAKRCPSCLSCTVMRNECICSAFSLIGMNIALIERGGDTRICFEHVLHRIVQLYSTSFVSMYLRLPIVECGFEEGKGVGIW